MSMPEILLLIIAAILASELLVRLPVMQQAHGLGKVARKSAATISSKRISDHWKERILPVYSVRMARCSVLFFLLLCCAMAPVALIGLAAPGGEARWLELLMQPTAIALLCAVSIAYIVLRLKVMRG